MTIKSMYTWAYLNGTRDLAGIVEYEKREIIY